MEDKFRVKVNEQGYDILNVPQTFPEMVEYLKTRVNRYYIGLEHVNKFVNENYDEVRKNGTAYLFIVSFDNIHLVYPGRSGKTVVKKNLRGAPFDSLEYTIKLIVKLKN